MLSFTPMEGRSLMRAPGTPGFSAIADWVDYQAFYQVEAHEEAGLCAPESDPYLGSFCWTSRRARLQVKATSGGHAVLRLSRPRHALLPRASATTLSTPWGKQDAVIGDGVWFENAISVPANFSDGDISVVLETEELLSPMRLLGNGDYRELGVQVSMDGVTPAPNPFRC